MQHLVFPKLKGIKYFPKRLFHQYPCLIPQNKNKDKLLFSSEFDRGLEDILQEISTNYPHARIIICFRQQHKWIVSKYKYYIRKHGHLTFNEFIDLENDKGEWKINELLYRPKIELIQKLFNNPPLVVLHQELTNSPTEFVNRITNFTGTTIAGFINKKINTAFSSNQLIYLRKFNNVHRYNELKSSSNLLNKVHYKYREFLLHIVSSLLRFAPKSDETLICDHKVGEIKKYFEKDWQFVVEYVKKES